MPLKKKPNYNPNNYFQSCYSSVFHFLFIIALHLLVHCFIFSLACKLLAVQGNTSIFSVIKHAAVIFQSFNVTKSKCSFYCTLQITLNSNTSYSIPLLCCIYNVTVLPQIHKVLQPLFWRSVYVIWGQRQNVSCKALQGTQLSHSWPCVLFSFEGQNLRHQPLPQRLIWCVTPCPQTCCVPFPKPGKRSLTEQGWSHQFFITITDEGYHNRKNFRFTGTLLQLFQCIQLFS